MIFHFFHFFRLAAAASRAFPTVEVGESEKIRKQTDSQKLKTDFLSKIKTKRLAASRKFHVAVCVAVCCSVCMILVSLFHNKRCSVLQCVAVCCSVLQCVAVCCSALSQFQCVLLCAVDLLQCVALLFLVGKSKIRALSTQYN